MSAFDPQFVRYSPEELIAAGKVIADAENGIQEERTGVAIKKQTLIRESQKKFEADTAGTSNALKNKEVREDFKKIEEAKAEVLLKALEHSKEKAKEKAKEKR